MSVNEDRLAQIEKMYTGARSRAFPGVPEISAAAVIARRAAGEELVLVDVRRPDEQQVSMIPGAITLDAFEANRAQYEGSTVVCYCTIGGRSGQQTQELCASGVDAINMPGSVLAWSHAGGEFVNQDGPTKRVHVNGKKFNLLAEGYDGTW